MAGHLIYPRAAAEISAAFCSVSSLRRDAAHG
jgi:hypothetical protein